jgi:hypothetical protein
MSIQNQMRGITMGTPEIKETLHQLADQLSDDATWDDVMEKYASVRPSKKGFVPQIVASSLHKMK